MNKVALIFLALVVTALLFALVGCDGALNHEEMRNRSECRTVAGVYEGLRKQDLRAFDQLDNLSTQEIALLSAITHSDSDEDPYTLCMRVNK